MAIVIGHVALIMTKSLSVDIYKASTWFSLIILSDESKEQLNFWQQNIRSINRKKMFCINKCSKMIFSDASASGFAGFQVSTVNKVVHGIWSPDEMVKSSTWRELFAVYKVSRSLVDSIKNSKVKWYSDNAAVCSVVAKGSMKTHLQEIAYDIFSFCVQHSVELFFEWIPRDMNDKADYFSKNFQKFWIMTTGGCLWNCLKYSIGNGDLSL